MLYCCCCISSRWCFELCIEFPGGDYVGCIVDTDLVIELKILLLKFDAMGLFLSEAFGVAFGVSFSHTGRFSVQH